MSSFYSKLEMVKSCELIINCFQIITNALMNQDTVWMAPPVNPHGRPPDVTVYLVSKETDVSSARRTFTDMIVVHINLLPYFSWIVIFMECIELFQSQTVIPLNKFVDIPHHQKRVSLHWAVIGLEVVSLHKKTYYIFCIGSGPNS